MTEFVIVLFDLDVDRECECEPRPGAGTGTGTGGCAPAAPRGGIGGPEMLVPGGRDSSIDEAVVKEVTVGADAGGGRRRDDLVGVL